MDSLTIEKHVVMLYTLYMYVHKTSSPFVFGNNFRLSHINVLSFSSITEVLFNDFVFQY